MRHSSAYRFASILLVGLGFLGCGGNGAPVSGQGDACKTQADCSSDSTLSCVSTDANDTVKSCEVLCTTNGDCPNDQPCGSLGNGPKFCQVNPG